MGAWYVQHHSHPTVDDALCLFICQILTKLLFWNIGMVAFTHSPCTHSYIVYKNIKSSCQRSIKVHIVCWLEVVLQSLRDNPHLPHHLLSCSSIWSCQDWSCKAEGWIQTKLAIAPFPLQPPFMLFFRAAYLSEAFFLGADQWITFRMRRQETSVLLTESLVWIQPRWLWAMVVPLCRSTNMDLSDYLVRADW